MAPDEVIDCTAQLELIGKEVMAIFNKNGLFWDQLSDRYGCPL